MINLNIVENLGFHRYISSRQFWQICFSIKTNKCSGFHPCISSEQFWQIHFSIQTNKFSGFHPCISSERSDDQCDQTLCWSTKAWLHCQMLVICLPLPTILDIFFFGFRIFGFDISLTYDTFWYVVLCTKHI